MKRNYLFQFGIAVIIAVILNILTNVNVNVAHAHDYPNWEAYDFPNSIVYWARCESGEDDGCSVHDQWDCTMIL